MTYQVISNNGKVANGTSFQGYVQVSYDQLVRTLGQPNGATQDGKVQAQWILKFEDGQVATIYDYKSEEQKEDIIVWHIGGKSKGVVIPVNQIFSFSEGGEHERIEVPKGPQEEKVNQYITKTTRESKYDIEITYDLRTNERWMRAVVTFYKDGSIYDSTRVGTSEINCSATGSLTLEEMDLFNQMLQLATQSGNYLEHNGGL